MILKLWTASTIRFFLLNKRYVWWDLSEDFLYFSSLGPWRRWTELLLSTLIYSSQTDGAKQWRETVKLSHQTDLRLEIIFNFHNVVIVWVNGRIQRFTLRQRPGKTWGGFFLLLHWSLFWYKRQSKLNMLNRTISIMEKGEIPLFVGCKRDNTLICDVLMGHK